jgi:hypothetical protein
MGEDLLIYQYKFMQGRDQLEFNGTLLSKPITTKVDKTKVSLAVLFNKALLEISKSDYQMNE